ncbi:MAG: hypothetical protein ABWY06_23085 [Pseudomonas sp.]|uniref:hypothetical protein n=1 Tax=Pseudomonas sp. TaxID=306 RepID=UPI00339A2F46
MSNFFRKSPLASACAALATLTGLLVSAPSQAVSLSQDGQGQVLLYPYYTVRGGSDTYLSLLNSSDVPILVTVHFRASTDSVLTLKLDLYLAAHDQWTGGVTATADGAKLISSDRSCTEPSIPQGGLPLELNRPNEDVMDVVREGSIQVFEHGEIVNPAIIAAISQTGGAPSCNLEPTPGLAFFGPPTDALSGTATLINVAGGTQYSYEPAVLEDFTSEPLWLFGTLDDAQPAVSQVLDKGRVITSAWERGSAAVSAVLMHASLTNEFVLEPTTQSGTDWVVNMPTKGWHQQSYGVFEPPFAADKCQYQFADTVVFRDREGRPNDDDVSTGTPADVAPVMCNDVSVLTFNNANLLASAHSENLAVNLDNGWGEFKFEGELVSLEGHRYKGLPLIGFMVHDFVNGNVGGLLSNYGGNFNHTYTTDIKTP